MLRAFDGLAEYQSLDQIVEVVRLAFERTGKSRRHLAQNHQDGVRLEHRGNLDDQLADAAQVAAAEVIGGDVGGDENHVAAGQVEAGRRIRKTFATLLEQLRQSGLDDRQVACSEPSDYALVWIETDGGEAARCRGGGGIDTEVGHSGKPDDCFVHSDLSCSAAWPSSRNDLLSQRSSARSVTAPDSHKCLKCAYSASQVGSSCTKVTVSSGGRPLGRTRVRSVKLLGPHLHRERM